MTLGLDVLPYRPMAPRSERTHDNTTDQEPNERPTNRLIVADAARLLGLSAEAVRMRIKRGTLASEKVDGTVYVILDADPTQSNVDLTQSNADPTNNQTTEPTTDKTAMVEVLSEHVAYLREQLDQEREANRENRRIIAGLVQRVPEIEATPGPRDASEPGPDLSPGVDPQGDDAGPEAGVSRPWWRRIFSG